MSSLPRKVSEVHPLSGSSAEVVSSYDVCYPERVKGCFHLAVERKDVAPKMLMGQNCFATLCSL